jgi:cardiolipin synthase
MIGLDELGLALTVIVHLAGAGVALRAAGTAHTAQGAVAWAVSLIAAPWIALPAYAVFGPLRGAPFTEAMHRARDAARAGRPPLARAECRDAAEAALWAPLEKLTPSPTLTASCASLLIDGDAIFGAMIEAIDKGRSHIFVQFYIVRDDRIGRDMAERLAERAREGVRVLFLYDEVGARNVPASYWSALRSAGVELRAFSLVSRLPKVLRLNFRNHRKIVAVDSHLAIVGGSNLGDEYLGRDPAFGAWRDTAVSLEGAAAAEIEAIFLEDWIWTGGGAPSMTPSQPPPKGDVPVLILPTGPVDPSPACTLAFLHLLASARERLWIASPYFVPGRDLMSSLKLAVLRGVDVRVLIPDRPDHRLVWLAAFAYAEEAFASGITLQRYTDGFMHQKALVIDDRVAAIGSANLDNRSFRLNFELTPLVFDPRFVADVTDMLSNDFARSRPHDRAFQDAQSVAVRSLAPAARLFAPLL